jgi:H+-translocating diphosphatase
MAELDPYVREKTDALDAAGNTTAAIGKGFAIGSAALVSLALFGAFVTRIRISSGDSLFAEGVNMLEPLTFAFLIVGGMIPFAFAAMTMKSVGEAAMAMVLEVQRQFDEKPHLLDANPTERPDYDACIAISTQASLREMIPPGAMVIFTPLLTGIFFGVTAVSGLLVGALIASVQLAISMSNSGGAWDNAKKYIERVCCPRFWLERCFSKCQLTHSRSTLYSRQPQIAICRARDRTFTKLPLLVTRLVIPLRILPVRRSTL